MFNENRQFDTALESVTCSDSYSYSILWVSCEYVLRP